MSKDVAEAVQKAAWTDHGSINLSSIAPNVRETSLHKCTRHLTPLQPRSYAQHLAGTG